MHILKYIFKAMLITYILFIFFAKNDDGVKETSEKTSTSDVDVKDLSPTALALKKDYDYIWEEPLEEPLEELSKKQDALRETEKNENIRIGNEVRNTSIVIKCNDINTKSFLDKDLIFVFNDGKVFYITKSVFYDANKFGEEINRSLKSGDFEDYSIKGKLFSFTSTQITLFYPFSPGDKIEYNIDTNNLLYTDPKHEHPVKKLTCTVIKKQKDI